VGEFYAPQTEGGLHYDDPRLGLEWPLAVTEISPKDAAWRPLSEVEPELRRRMTVRTRSNDGAEDLARPEAVGAVIAAKPS
jgi:hypothetical protein